MKKLTTYDGRRMTTTDDGRQRRTTYDNDGRRTTTTDDGRRRRTTDDDDGRQVMAIAGSGELKRETERGCGLPSLYNAYQHTFIHSPVKCNKSVYRCQTTNSPISAWNICESTRSPFSRKKLLSLCSIVKTTEWNGLIKIDN